MVLLYGGGGSGQSQKGGVGGGIGGVGRKVVIAKTTVKLLKKGL